MPERITTELVNNGLGRSSESCLERVISVAKSSGQRIGSKRANPLEHYESMKVRDYCLNLKKLL